MHDRSDYKSGWQLEKEWEEEQERKRRRLLQGFDGDDDDENYEISSEDDELPFACHICRREEGFVRPVETR